MPQEIPSEDESRAGSRDWPHAPPHRLEQAGVYFLTARTRARSRLFHTPERLTFVRDTLLARAAHYGWRLEAWAVLANHYHLIVHSPVNLATANSMVKFIRHLHGDVSRYLNRLDGTPGRECWQNYWETHLTHPKSYVARLNYVHRNPVHHRLVTDASDYEWCSARDFEKACTPAWVKTVGSFHYDRIAEDDYDFD